jgi:undecaprenyl-diphosphatase
MKTPADPPTPDTGPSVTSRALKLALLALAAVALVLLIDRLGNAERVDEPSDLDVFIHNWVIRHRPGWPWLTGFFHLATRFGNPDVATAATAVVTFGLYTLWRRGVSGVRRSEALVWLGAILGGRCLSLLLKLVYRRERPPLPHRLVVESSFSYPSGHSLFAAVFFTMLAALLARIIPPTRPGARAGAVAACLALAVLVGVSRIWLGVHYPTDVIGGLLLGFAWVYTVVLARRVWDRYRGRVPGGA